MSNTTVYIVAFQEYIGDEVLGWRKDQASEIVIREKKAYPELMQATKAAHEWANQSEENDFEIDIVEYA